MLEEYGKELWHLEFFDEIDFGLLPDKFVLKTTHDQGGVVIAKINQLLILKPQKKLNKHLEENILLINGNGSIRMWSLEF